YRDAVAPTAHEALLGGVAECVMGAFSAGKCGIEKGVSPFPVTVPVDRIWCVTGPDGCCRCAVVGHEWRSALGSPAHGAQVFLVVGDGCLLEDRITIVTSDNIVICARDSQHQR